ERFLVARLRSGEHVEVLALLVADERLVEVRFLLDDVDEVVDDAALATHDEVEVAQADVEVDDRGLVPREGEAGGEAGAGGGLADPALAGGDDDDAGHRWRFLEARRWEGDAARACTATGLEKRTAPVTSASCRAA